MYRLAESHGVRHTAHATHGRNDRNVVLRVQRGCELHDAFRGISVVVNDKYFHITCLPESKFFKKLYFLKLANRYNKDIVSSLNLKPNQTFLVNKYKMQAGYFTEKELRKILQELRDLDVNYKNGLIDLEIGLESILCGYC